MRHCRMAFVYDTTFLRRWVEGNAKRPHPGRSTREAAAGDRKKILAGCQILSYFALTGPAGIGMMWLTIIFWEAAA